MGGRETYCLTCTPHHPGRYPAALGLEVVGPYSSPGGPRSSALLTTSPMLSANFALEVGLPPKALPMQTVLSELLAGGKVRRS